MQKRTREIIALVLLVVLLVGGVGAAAWYIFVGHNWNAAATRIDDRIGSMEGYTVILCEGAIPPTMSQQAQNMAQSIIEEIGNEFESGEGESQREALTIDEAIESYHEKGAKVITLFDDDPAMYSDPIVIRSNGLRIAVFSVGGPRPDLAARNMVKFLRDRDIDFTVCLIDDYIAVEKGLGGVDLAFCSDPDDAGSEGRYIHSTYVVGCPYEGHVAAVIMAPSGFLSSKMVVVR